MVHYILALLCSASILLAAFFAIRFRKVSAVIRMAALAFSAALVLLLYFLCDDATQLYGLGILAVAFIFTLFDIKKGHSPGGGAGRGLC